MKKLIYSVAIICILASVLSCKSTKAGKKAGKKGEAPVTAEAEEALLPEAADGIAAAEGAEAQVEETGKKASKRKAKKNKKNAPKEDADYTGWKKSSKKNITERYGKVQLKIKPGIGSYTIATLNAKEKAVPVLSTSNEFVANAFYLKTSKKTYNLVTDNAVRSTARRTTDGAVITYEIPQVAQVNVFFTCFASQKKKDTDMVKISLSVKNTGKRNDDFSIKAILDTVLGESAPYHFYTWEDIPVKNEVLYRTLQNQKWFLSKNLNGAMQLFFTGADCTVPELVAFANYATLDNTAWEPDMLSYRVFDTVLSYNNSAVCAIWKPMKLAPDDIGKVTFYLALAAEGAQPTGEKYIYSKEFADKLLANIEDIPIWMYNNNIQICEYYIEQFEDVLNYYQSITDKQLVALALFDFGKRYNDIPKKLLEKMYSMAQQEKSIKPLLKYKEFNDLSYATKKWFNTVSVKKIAELLKLLIEIHSFYNFPQEIVNQLNKYVEIGNEYYKDFNKYIKYIEANSIPVTLSDSIPDYCHK